MPAKTAARYNLPRHYRAHLWKGLNPAAVLQSLSQVGWFGFAVVVGAGLVLTACLSSGLYPLLLDAASLRLVFAARQVREKAYAPYSHFAVGAALRTKGGRVFCGCNVENLSFGLTSCAERNAVFAAVAAGEREFESVAIVADSKEPVTPCGACRQVLAEFCDDLPVLIVDADAPSKRTLTNLRELLPGMFKL